MEKFFTKIWIINGILILIAALLFIWQEVRRYIPRTSPVEHGPIVGENLAEAIKDTLALQDISMKYPSRVGSTPFFFIELYARDLKTAVRIMKFSDLGPPPLAGDYGEPIVDYVLGGNRISSSTTMNLLFYKEGGADAHLLLDKKALIKRASMPWNRDTSQKYIFYELIFQDSDGDGRLTYQDRSDLYVSNLFGNDLRQVTDSSVSVRSYLKLKNEDKLYIEVMIRPTDRSIDKEDWAQKFLVYDLKENKFIPFVPVESLIDSARKILWSK